MAGEWVLGLAVGNQLVVTDFTYYHLHKFLCVIIRLYDTVGGRERDDMKVKQTKSSLS